MSEIGLRLVLAAIFGAVIGVERERKEWSAGMRTHMLVCMGSCLMMLVSSFGFADTADWDKVSLDPSRVAAQIVSGIGFIGAGAILFLKPSTILGLTTASGLWTVAGIGMATGGGMYFAATATTVLAIIILWGLQPLQKKFSPKFKQSSMVIVAAAGTNPKVIIDRLLEDKAIDFSNFSVNNSPDEMIVELKLEKSDNPVLAQIVENLNADPSIKKITWNK